MKIVLLWRRMFSRILTDYERRKIRKYLANGERLSEVRTIAWRATKYQSQIKSDLALLERFLASYEKT
jgi:hypothetical protein